MDIVKKVRRYPLPGETIKSLDLTYCPGGKGANQAMAIHLSGCEVYMVGAVGQDPIGKQLLSHFDHLGVNTNNIDVIEGTSGMAFITVNERGENHIVISEGANANLSKENVELVIRNSSWGEGDTVLLQNEIPWTVTKFVIEQASCKGIQVVFNPAPALKIPENAFSLIDTLILNETEAQYITGMKISDHAEALKAIQSLINRGVKEVIITLGENGALYLNQDQDEIFQPAFSVKVVDTTAAGDTFIGTFIAARGNSYLSTDHCLRFASAAAALTVTRQGAQSSIPTIAEVETFLSDQVESRLR